MKNILMSAIRQNIWSKTNIKSPQEVSSVDVSRIHRSISSKAKETSEECIEEYIWHREEICVYI